MSFPMPEAGRPRSVGWYRRPGPVRPARLDRGAGSRIEQRPSAGETAPALSLKGHDHSSLGVGIGRDSAATGSPFPDERVAYLSAVTGTTMGPCSTDGAENAGLVLKLR